MDKENPSENFGKVLVESIKTISSQQVEIAKSEISQKQDVFFQAAIEKTKEEARKMSKEAIKEEIDSVKKDMFVTFGIFTSFIAFIVGEINILKTIDSIYDKIGFSFLFVSFILGFLFGIMFLFDDEKYENKFKKMSYIFSFFFIVGIIFIILSSISIKPTYYIISQ